LYAAICASPAIVFQPHGLLEGEKATCYPIFQENLKEKHVNQRVVVSNNCGNIFYHVSYFSRPWNSYRIRVDFIRTIGKQGKSR